LLKLANRWPNDIYWGYYSERREDIKTTQEHFSIKIAMNIQVKSRTALLEKSSWISIQDFLKLQVRTQIENINAIFMGKSVFVLFLYIVRPPVSQF
jgi:hypothetical protein